MVKAPAGKNIDEKILMTEQSLVKFVNIFAVKILCHMAMQSGHS